MLSDADRRFFQEHGWLIVRAAVAAARGRLTGPAFPILWSDG